MREWWCVFLLAGAIGCAVPAPKDTLPSDGKRFVGWRLAERTYGSIDEGWATAQDGEIPSGAMALIYEPVYRERMTFADGLVTAWTACGHAPHVEYAGPPSRNVGERVTVRVWIEGPQDVGHVVEFAGTHGAVKILGVSGAEILAGECGRTGPRYHLGAGKRAEVIFTCDIPGRGGLRVRVAGETVGGGPGVRPSEGFLVTDTSSFARKGRERSCGR